MRYRRFAGVLAVEILVLLALVAGGQLSASRSQTCRRHNRQLVQLFELTDLSIWTGARYTRHLSQADLFSAFQDSLGAMEHFPAGALAPLPSVCPSTGPAFRDQAGPATAGRGATQDDTAS